MRILRAAVCGYGTDLLLGDPEWLAPAHPVVLMGKGIRRLEEQLRPRFPKTPEGESLAGAVLALCMTAGTGLGSLAALRLLRRLSRPLGFGLEALWCWQALAVRDLSVEAERVRSALEQGGLEAARAAVSKIVGRDTAELEEPGVLRAAVETVAENFADGIVAPLFYMMIGGAPLALWCKAVNTMDSMIGYKNDKYQYFGRAAAKLDDAVNFLPARLGALLLMQAAFFCGEDVRGAFRIWKRDRRNHESPNSGQCEAAMAGALGLRLCGPASYSGKRKEKPWIGDDLHEIRPEDIHRACRMDEAGSAIALLSFGILRLMVKGWN